MYILCSCPCKAVIFIPTYSDMLPLVVFSSIGNWGKQQTWIDWCSRFAEVLGPPSSSRRARAEHYRHHPYNPIESRIWKKERPRRLMFFQVALRKYCLPAVLEPILHHGLSHAAEFDTKPQAENNERPKPVDTFRWLTRCLGDWFLFNALFFWNLNQPKSISYYLLQGSPEKCLTVRLGNLGGNWATLRPLLDSWTSSSLREQVLESSNPTGWEMKILNESLKLEVTTKVTSMTSKRQSIASSKNNTEGTYWNGMLILHQKPKHVRYHTLNTLLHLLALFPSHRGRCQVP